MPVRSEIPTWDIFCRVVDNYGDAGVCWRLARQLANEHGAIVRLWIDDLASLQRLEPALASDADDQVAAGVRVSRWLQPMPEVAPAEIVIEAFGCGLPDEYVRAMAEAAKKPVWVVLEYLSAEAWVASHHALPSPHPHWPLERYFFFPGFVEGTGGLSREADLFARRDRCAAAGRDRVWERLGHRPVPQDALAVSVFAYASAPLAALLEGWEEGGVPVVAALPESALTSVVLRHFGVEALPPERVLRRGALEVRIVPFMPQVDFDEFLWACDVNFVRGEDSFVRAQWAARPFVWQIYPQEERAHQLKLDAFLALYTEGLDVAAREAVTRFMRCWNRLEAPAVTPALAWAEYAAHIEALKHHGAAWAARIGECGPLAANLARFCLSKLK